MDIEKRKKKEDKIILAAEDVFTKVGFGNAKMDDIAAEAGITKVTLYSYFQSKENLYMALTYKAFLLLIDMFYRTIEDNKSEKGIESSIAIESCFMDFCENNFLYSEAMLHYFALVRSTNGGNDEEKLTSGIKESIFFNKIKGIHNLPLKLTAQEIERGQKDGSIRTDENAMLMTLQGWSMIVGYAKLLTSSKESTTLLGLDLKDLRALNLELTRTGLTKGL